MQVIVSILSQDAVRTDRDLQYFANPDGPHTTQLIDIMVTFAVAEPSVPYTQGMTDLLSPILVVMQDEVRRLLSYARNSDLTPRFTGDGVCCIPAPHDASPGPL